MSFNPLEKFTFWKMSTPPGTLFGGEATPPGTLFGTKYYTLLLQVPCFR